MRKILEIIECGARKSILMFLKVFFEGPEVNNQGPFKSRIKSCLKYYNMSVVKTIRASV